MSYSTNAKTALDSFNSVYYIESIGTFKNTMFWDRAEMIEMIEDAYEKIGDTKYKTQLQKLIDASIQISGELWNKNPYFDDVLWLILAFIRASKILNNSRYFEIAKNNFDYITENGFNAKYNLVEWKDGEPQGSAVSSCVYATCASLIYKETNDETYVGLGRNVLDNVFTYLYNPDNGHVYDHILENGFIEYFEHVYNSAMFCRACSEIYDCTQDEKYLNEIDKAASYIIHKKYNSEIMCDHESGDGAGFKAILARQLRYIADHNNLPDYLEYLRISADSAWENRNKYNLMQNDFCQKTADHKLWRAFDAHSAVTLLINCI